jgi:hypothetical protein
MDGMLDDALCRRFGLSEVRRDRRRSDSKRPNLLQDFDRILLVRMVMDADVGSFGGEPTGDRPTEPNGSARDDGSLSANLHRSVERQRGWTRLSGSGQCKTSGVSRTIGSF